MFEASFIQKFKRINISADSEKTKQRVQELWKSASNDNKKIIEELAGVTRPSVARVYEMGSISAKIAVSMSQTLNVSPYYLIGEADDQGESSDQILREFLIKLGYEGLLTEHDNELMQPAEKSKQSKARKPGRKAQKKSQTTVNTKAVEERFDREMREALDTLAEEYKQNLETQESVIEIFEVSAPSVSFFDEFEEDDILALLRSVKLRAKAGVPGAIKQAEELKKILLS